MRAILFLGLLAMLAGRPVLAEDIPGQAAPEFQAAVSAWLDDAEDQALPGLARLAGEGNPAAQMLLALIDKSPALQGPWLAHLPRRERVETMRAPGGMSGRSWMRAAAAQVPLAGLWLELWTVDARMALVIDFAREDERRAARETVTTLAARERSGFSDIATDADFPPAMRYQVWMEWRREADMQPAIDSELALLAPGDPQRALMGEAVSEADLADWLLTAPAAGPVARLCNSRCGSAPADCALAAFAALGSYQTLVTFGTPSERLIPAETFDNSPRGQAALLRRALLNADARGRRAQIARAGDTDACFADLLQAEMQRFMPRRD
jgi:hypothetical protein